MFKPLLFALIVTATSAVLANPAVIVTPELQSALVNPEATANVFVNLREDTSKVLQEINSNRYRFSDRAEKLNALHSALRQHAAVTQAPILSFLSSTVEEDLEFTSFWIANRIFIKNADLGLVTTLASKFPQLIESVEEEVIASLVAPLEVGTKLNASRTDYADHEWGVLAIQAPDAWDELGGHLNAGEGVIIATSVSGVRGTHEALRDNFVGTHGWFDPSSYTPEPTDDMGHGTHTTGVIVGTLGIGVAPKAKWAACRACPTLSCAGSHLLSCGQFFLCPTLPDGFSNPDCSKAPHVVSNMWGLARGGGDFYNPVIDAWHAAGIVPLFPIGNAGPSCGSAYSPGDQGNVIGVGSTTISESISASSSAGPTSDGRVKPDICAPGSDVISAYHTADNAYASMSGTATAAAHAAGTIALLHSRDKEISFQEASELLLVNTHQGELIGSGRVCGGVGDDHFPNHVFGNGRINAYKSVVAQTRLMKAK